MNEQAAFDLPVPAPREVTFSSGTKVEQESHRLSIVAKDAGVTAAAKADPDLFDMATEAIERRADTGEEFNADDIRADLAGVSGPAIGSAFRAAAARGIITMVGFTTSNSVTRHGGLGRLWTGGRS